MHILYIHQHFCTPEGSTGTRSYAFARKLVARGHKVTMVCGNFQMAKTGLSGNFVSGVRCGVVDGIDIIEVNVAYSNYDNFFSRVRKFLIFAFKASKYALLLKYDVVFTTSTPLTAALPGILAKIFRGKRFIFEVRDLWPELPKAMGIIKSKSVLAILSFFEWLSYRVADQCIGLSPGIVSGIKSRLSSKQKNKVFFLPNGCDTEFFNNADAKNIDLPIADDDFVAVFAGAHGQANGLQAVLDAAYILQQNCENKIKLLFVGNGALKPGLMRKAQNIPGCVFLDPVPKTQLRNILKRANVGLMMLANVPAFYYGTSPNKFFDYIACGLPVLVNYPGWVADLIQKNHAGIAVEPESAEQFANALICLSKMNQVELANLSKNATNLSKLFVRDEISDRFTDLIESNFDEKFFGEKFYG